MKVGWLAAGAALVIALAVFGARAKAAIELTDRIQAFREEARDRVIGPRRGVDSVPTEVDVRAAAEALATERGLELTEVSVRIERDVAPETFGARRVSGELGAIGERTVDAEGNVTRTAPRTLRTTRVTFTAHVRGHGFLVTREADVEVRREIGYGL